MKNIIIGTIITLTALFTFTHATQIWAQDATESSTMDDRVVGNTQVPDKAGKSAQIDVRSLKQEIAGIQDELQLIQFAFAGVQAQIKNLQQQAKDYEKRFAEKQKQLEKIQAQIKTATQ